MITFIIFSACSNGTLNGMLSLTRHIKAVGFKQFSRLNYIHNHKNSSNNEAVHIQEYLASRDEIAVKKIAEDNIFSLVSVPLGKDCDRKKIAENEIISAANSSNFFSKVYRKDDKTIGFINYGLRPSWYSKTFPEHIGLDAKIYHLAIEKEYQGKGHGTLLLNHALKDCKEKSAHSASLWTTGGSFAGDYYKKQGFNLKRRTKLNEEQWEMRFQPHPVKILRNVFLIWLID